LERLWKVFALFGTFALFFWVFMHFWQTMITRMARP
jgi:hypothetical protein